jgi:replicative DNA helicase
MSKEIKDKAREYLKAQLSVIPTKEDKLPAVPTWKPYQSQRMKEEEVDTLFSGSNVKGLAIICGAISGGLEVIDVDTKHDPTGSLWEELRGLIEDNLPELYIRLVIAQTRSGGYHIYYRCSYISGNLKLSTKLNREVLIETRGEGGYVIAPPTPNYTYIQGDPGNIPTITTEERAILFSIAKSFNEQEEIKPKVSTSSSTTSSSTGISPFEDYNQRGDLVALLESKGWKVVDKKGQRINLLRPGSTDSKTSGNYHTEKNVLRVFSSSTEFDPDKGYSPAQVFSLLECNGDNKLTYRRLLELGYGEPYKGEDLRPTQVKTELIKVEVVNKVNRESSVISTPGESLKIENIQTAIGEEVVITSPGSEAQDEILRAIDLIQETGKRIYIKEGGKDVREYRYQLQAVFNKYGAIQDERGGLTDKERDSLLDEVVIISTKLQPIDKDIFLKDFVGLEPIKELGITEESLSITVDRLTSSRDKEAQAQELNRLLKEATDLHTKGETAQAIEILDSKVKEVKLKDKATEFNSLLLPIKEGEIRERQANKPSSLRTGIVIQGEDLLLPSGAISIIALPTSHGKTTITINLALNVVEAYPDKEIYLFSYEEDKDSILMKALNTYVDEEKLSLNNRRSIQSYFSTGSPEYIKTDVRDHFLRKKGQFFRELIDTRRLNIHYSAYDSDSLNEAIRYLHKNANPGAVFIDYMQLLHKGQGGRNKYNSRQEELKQICLDLKDVAVETGLPIILGAQFNREVIAPTRVHATKIGEAGDIERIANLIIGGWNGNFKPISATEGELQEINSKGMSNDNTLYLKILKNRDGAVGIEQSLDFNGNTGKIKNSSTSSIKGNNPF